MKNYNYNLNLIGKKEPLELSQAQGQKLAIILMQPDCPKFVLIGDDVVAVSCINSLMQIKFETRMNKFGVVETFDMSIDRGTTTDKDVAIYQKYIALRKKFTEQLE